MSEPFAKLSDAGRKPPDIGRFILQTNDACGRTCRANIFSVSVNASLSSSCLETGIRRIMRREALYALMRLQRRTKAFTQGRRETTLIGVVCSLNRPNMLFL